MSKKLFDLQQIRNVAENLRKKIKDQRTERIADPILSVIKYPQIPSELSESLAIHLIKKKVVDLSLDENTIKFGGYKADLVGKKENHELKIEVKATSDKGFQYFSQKDITADYLIWIHFGEYFNKDNAETIELFILETPLRFFDHPRKITLSELKKICSISLEHKTCNLNSFLGITSPNNA